VSADIAENAENAENTENTENTENADMGSADRQPLTFAILAISYRLSAQRLCEPMPANNALGQAHSPAS
jgi:hypothetical protein